MTSETLPITDPGPTPAPTPSQRIWLSAMAGLLGLGAACGGDSNVEEDPHQHDAAAVDAGGDASSDATPTKVIRETPGEHTFAELKAMCDERGGYTEIHSACSGSNTCAGFSYGDWGDSAVLVEHSCNAVSGCNGIGCVDLPSDTAPGHGRSAEEILAEMVPDVEGVAQRSCNYCHAAWSDEGFDPTIFKLRLPPGSPRNLGNWKDTPAEVQERIIAFGAHGVYSDGTAYSSMAGYYQKLSRAEIERVVEYIRSDQVTVEIAPIKTQDDVNLRRAIRARGGDWRPKIIKLPR